MAMDKINFSRIAAVTITALLAALTTASCAFAKAPSRAVSSGRPLILLVAGADISLDWKNVPLELKPLSMMVAAPGPEYDTPEKRLARVSAVADTAAKKHIPAVLRAAFDGEPLPVAEITKMISARGSAVRGIEIDGFENMASGGSLIALKQLLDAADRAGIWAILRTDSPLILDFVASADFAEALAAVRAHAPNIIIMHSLRGSAPHDMIRSTALGLWLTGAASQYGISVSPLMYSDSGYWGLNQYRGPGDGNIAQMPLTFYAKITCVGIASGASVYEFNAPWGKDALSTEKDAWHILIYPLMRKTVAEKLIPSRGEALVQTHAAYRPDFFNSPETRESVQRDIDTYYSTGNLFRAVYGETNLSIETEIIPSESRYGFIPVVPADFANTQNTFDRLITAGEGKTAEDYAAMLDPLYPPKRFHRAWEYDTGRHTFVIQNRENTEEGQLAYLEGPAQPADLKVDATAGKPIKLSWANSSPGTRYNIYAKRNDETFFTRINDKPVDSISWATPSFPFRSNGLREFAVTAIAAATTSQYYHIGYDYMFIVPAGESMIDSSAVVSNDGKNTYHNTIDRTGTPVDLRVEELSRNISCVVSEPAIRDRLAALARAVAAQDTAAVAEIYSDSYLDDLNNDKTAIINTYEAFFKKISSFGPPFDYPPGALNRAHVELLNVFTSEDEKQTFADTWVFFAGVDPRNDSLIRIPAGPDRLVEFTFVNEGDADSPAWRIIKSSPPLPNTADFLK